MDDVFPAQPLNPKECEITNSQKDKCEIKPVLDEEPKVLQAETLPIVTKREPLSTKNAIKFLLEGTLKAKVCRYCLNISSELSELDQILQIADKGTLYSVTIKDMVASFHPFKVSDDPNFPNQICNNCINRTLTSYLFTQQCDRAERALRNCFDDMYDKLTKLDPLERTHKRGRQKLNPNYNALHAEYEKVMEYADPIINIVHTSEPLTEQEPIQEFECLKCAEVLPNLNSLLNHTTIHPKSMWYNCRLCGRSFPKLHHLKKHFRKDHSEKAESKVPKNKTFECKTCGVERDNCNEFLQHQEKHTFKTVMKHLVEGKMDKLCSICLSKGKGMTELGETISLHGGCPELVGERTLYSIVAGVLPEVDILDLNAGSKICEKCLSHAITSYVFTNQTYHVRNRLDTIVSFMLDNLNKIEETDKNICIEIAESAIMKIDEVFDDNDEDFDETKVEVLEDEFRLKSEDENEESDTVNVKEECLDTPTIIKNEPHLIEEVKSNTLVNGYKMKESICNNKLLNKKKKMRAPKFNCPLCQKHFISDYFLKRHILKHVPKKVDCDSCNSKFKSKFDLYEHKKMVHVLKSTHESCKVCSRRYADEQKLKHHLKRHRNKQCDMCHKTFKLQNDFNSHMRRHMHKLGMIMKKHTQNCSFCEKDCSNDNEFSLHVNKVHLQIKPYGCDMCERHFYTEYNLRSHKKLHSFRSKEHCNFCNKTLNSRMKLVVHIRKHIGETPFFCQLCNKSFYSQSYLRKHMNLQHGGNFLCKICKITFTIKKELKEHATKAHNS